MPTKTVHGDTIKLGDVLSVEAAKALALTPQRADDGKIDGNKNGVKVFSEAIRTYVPHPDGTSAPILFYATLTIQREPLDEKESLELKALMGDREAAKTLRDQKEADKIKAEKDAMFSLGQDATMKAIQNIGALAAGADALTRLRR